MERILKLAKTAKRFVKRKAFYCTDALCITICVVVLLHTNYYAVSAQTDKDMESNPSSSISDQIDSEIETGETNISTDQIQETTTNQSEQTTAQTTIPEEKTDKIYHVVKSGDNFWKMSNQYYNSSAYFEALREYNKFTSKDTLHVGDKIEIPSINDTEFKQIFDRIESEHEEQNKAYEESVKGNVMKAGTNPNGYKYGKRQNPAVDIRIPSDGESMKNYTGKVDTSKFQYLGKYSTTGYTPKCMHCCGNTKGIGAAGVQIICGYSVAASRDIPLGVTLYVEGYGFYVNEDRGSFGGKNIDIACPDHDTCSTVTNRKNPVNVYIVPNN